MRNITVSVDEETHRLARVRAAELDTSVSALVRDYLRGLACGRHDVPDIPADRLRSVETPRERRRRLMNEVFDDIRASRSGFSAYENVPREELYERRALR